MSKNGLTRYKWYSLPSPLSLTFSASPAGNTDIPNLMSWNPTSPHPAVGSPILDEALSIPRSAYLCPEETCPAPYAQCNGGVTSLSSSGSSLLGRDTVLPALSSSVDKGEPGLSPKGLGFHDAAGSQATVNGWLSPSFKRPARHDPIELPSLDGLAQGLLNQQGHSTRASGAACCPATQQTTRVTAALTQLTVPAALSAAIFPVTVHYTVFSGPPKLSHFHDGRRSLLPVSHLITECLTECLSSTVTPLPKPRLRD